MLHQEFNVPTELQDSIKCFWYHRRESEEIESGFQVMPDGYAEIIFHFGPVLNIVLDGVHQPLPSPFMMGLLNQPVIFDAKDRLEIIAIRCFPWTVFDLLGLSAGKEAVRRFEHPIARLQSSLHELIRQGEIEGAVEQVKQYFLGARSQVSAQTLLFKAGAAMRKANGTMPVAGVAAAAHASVRTLERNFKKSSGHSVKDVSGLIRFEQARNKLWQFPEANLAGLAHDLGYADQSHFSREFKRYSGSTPAAFIRNTRKGKHAVSPHFVAFVQS